MAACGITSIPIGKTQVSAGLLQQALKSTKGIKSINAAVAKSYAIVQKTGVSLEAWEEWYQRFNDPKATGILDREDIFNDPKLDFDKRFENLINLVGFDTSDYIVGNYAKRVFNRVRSNLLARGKGLTLDEIQVMQISLRSVLTKDRLHQDARKLRAAAKKNIKTKLGANTFLKPMMEKVLALEPEFIPADRLDAYYRLLQEFGQFKKVLSLRDSGVIAQEIQNLIQGLPDSLFVKQKADQKAVEDVPVDVMSAMIKNKKIDSSALSNPTEIEYAEKLAKFTKEQLETLDNADLQVILDSIDSINNGVFPPALLDAIINIEANENVEGTIEHAAKVKPLTWKNFIGRGYANIKAYLKGGKTTGSQEVIRGNPLTAIDEFFGNKGRQIYNATFGKLASAYSKYETEVKGINDRLTKIENKLAKKFKGNALVKAKFKMKYYQMQREFEANPTQDVYAADEWIKATIADENLTGFYNDESIAILEEIQKEFQGKTSEEILSTFGKEETLAIAEMDAINDGIVPKALFTAGVIRGEQATMFNHYTHHNVIGDDAQNLAEARKKAFTSPGSTKAGTVNERTEGVKPISFDPIYDLSTASRGLLLDYHMTPVNREVLRTVNRLEERFRKGNKEQRLATQALHRAVKEVLENVFDANAQEYSNGDAFVEKVKALSYQATLASGPRAVAELLSNAGFALGAAPSQFISGSTKYFGVSRDITSVSIMDNVGSAQTQKLFETGIAGSKHVETIIASGKRKQAQAVSEFRESVERKAALLGKPVSWTAKQVDAFANSIISSPDKMVSRPLWFGAFAEVFEKKSGEAVDFAKIKANDKAYMEKHAAAIKEARLQADQLSVMSGATNNPFSGILKLTSQ